MSSCLIFTCRRGSLREAIAAVSIKCGPAFTRIVVGDRKDVNTADEKVMPSFGADRNVMCYFDDIYVLSASPLGRQAGWWRVDRKSTWTNPQQLRKRRRLVWDFSTAHCLGHAKPRIPLGVLGRALRHVRRESHPAETTCDCGSSNV